LISHTLFTIAWMFTVFFLDKFPPELTPKYPELAGQDSLSAHSVATSELTNSAPKVGHAYAGPSDVHSGSSGGGSSSSLVGNGSSPSGLSNLGASSTNSATDLATATSVLANDSVLNNFNSLTGSNSQPLVNIPNLDTLSSISPLSGGISDLNQVTGTSLPENYNLPTFPQDEGIITDLNTLGGTIGETYNTNNTGQLGGLVYLDPAAGDTSNYTNASPTPPYIPEPAALVLLALGTALMLRQQRTY